MKKIAVHAPSVKKVHRHLVCVITVAIVAIAAQENVGIRALKRPVS